MIDPRTMDILAAALTGPGDVPLLSAAVAALRPAPVAVYAEDERLPAGLPNTCGPPGYPEFRDHRCDPAMPQIMRHSGWREQAGARAGNL